MARYVDGFLIPLKKSKVAAYKKMATAGRKMWMDSGALDYYECQAAKLDNDWGISFKKLCKLKPTDTLIFAYVVYKSKTHREQVIKKVGVHPLMKKFEKDFEMPYDIKRFTSGEFKAIVHT